MANVRQQMLAARQLNHAAKIASTGTERRKCYRQKVAAFAPVLERNLRSARVDDLSYRAAGIVGYTVSDVALHAKLSQLPLKLRMWTHRHVLRSGRFGVEDRMWAARSMFAEAVHGLSASETALTLLAEAHAQLEAAPSVHPLREQVMERVHGLFVRALRAGGDQWQGAAAGDFLGLLSALGESEASALRIVRCTNPASVEAMLPAA
jgi:hypothetical protein